MAKARRNHGREIRIHDEIIVDAHGPEEQAMGWYYYLEEKLQFPFQAQCIASYQPRRCEKGTLSRSERWRLRVAAQLTCS